MLLVAIARVRDSQAVHYPNFRNAAVYGNGPPMDRSACHGPGGQFTEAWALARLELNWIVQGIDRGEDFT
jgi:hypothetical protein